MEKTLLAKRKKSQLSVDQTGQMFIDDKPAKVAAAIEFYNEGEQLSCFPSASKVRSIEEAAAAQREKIDEDITKVEAAIEAANRKFYRDRDAWNLERERIEALEKECQEFRRRRPPMGSTYTEEQKLGELKTERAKVSEALSEASKLRTQPKLGADELAQISNEAALMGRIRKAV